MKFLEKCLGSILSPEGVELIMGFFVFFFLGGGGEEEETEGRQSSLTDFKGGQQKLTASEGGSLKYLIA